MIGFFIKKAFFDGWDNLLGLVLQNLIYMVAFLGFIGALALIDTHTLLSLVLLVIVLFVTCILFGGTSETVRGYSNYEKETWEPFAKGIKRNIGHSIVFAVISLLIVFVLGFVMPFYLSMGHPVGLIIGIILFWVSAVFLFALPYYFPLMNLLPGDRPKKTLKKCFIIFSDNLLFSLFFFIYNIIVVALSIVTVGIMPGVGGYMLASQDAMKLLMFKYDWLEENPDEKGKNAPWAELLYEEKEKIGPRTLKSMIFPWKY